MNAPELLRAYLAEIQIKLLREALDTLAAYRAFNKD
jgi:hypothetical protein